MENYIHATAILQALNCNVAVTDWCDVPQLVAEQIHNASGSATLWVNLDEVAKKKKEGNAKRRLNTDAVDAMTLAQLQQIDVAGEIYIWLCAIRDRCQ